MINNKIIENGIGMEEYSELLDVTERVLIVAPPASGGMAFIISLLNKQINLGNHAIVISENVTSYIPSWLKMSQNMHDLHIGYGTAAKEVDCLLNPNIKSINVTHPKNKLILEQLGINKTSWYI